MLRLGRGARSANPATVRRHPCVRIRIDRGREFDDVRCDEAVARRVGLKYQHAADRL
jgi:hypothetical protein